MTVGAQGSLATGDVVSRALVWSFVRFKAGFAFGAGLVAGFAEEQVLDSALGIACALLFDIFAYLYYAVAVVIVMASIGFLLGPSLVVASGIEWNWVTALVGVFLGALLGVASVVVDVPMLVLVLLSAAAGPSASSLRSRCSSTPWSPPPSDGSFTSRIEDHWSWYAALRRSLWPDPSTRPSRCAPCAPAFTRTG
jgi:hypothetical protein